MSSIVRNSGNAARKSILILSASQYLSGRPISEVVKADWVKDKARDIADKFDNVGFTVDPTNVPETLECLQKTIQGNAWDGVIFGWCTRGRVEFTVLFEKMVSVVFRQASVQPELKIMFCEGPQDLVQTTRRNFAV
ncbi:hypothetical protein UA08_09339 [Talaromyces atroroseus]|uniref:NADPH-dependent FMN reductase-like domain-containing protein n=1 Tax=Talaromyces atroroseus TaxID=1441469 RepID=A0A1Q5Q6B4_TALAT|nr:hypothetical protein UA08_09339 [Talaromyces atroroseus]OKL55396.1 hypothetical protein UA08_09339 [Talaromyces atroroseus]